MYVLSRHTHLLQNPANHRLGIFGNRSLAGRAVHIMSAPTRIATVISLFFSLLMRSRMALSPQPALKGRRHRESPARGCRGFHRPAQGRNQYSPYTAETTIRYQDSSTPPASRTTARFGLLGVRLHISPTPFPSPPCEPTRIVNPSTLTHLHDFIWVAGILDVVNAPPLGQLRR